MSFSTSTRRSSASRARARARRRSSTCGFFAGMTREEIGALLGVSSDTVKNDWRAARAWLRRWMSQDD